MTKKTIRQRLCGAFAAVTMAALGLGAIAGDAAAQSAKDLHGTWILVSNTNTGPDGKSVQPFGPNPHGILTFDAAGRYAIQVMRGGQAKFASPDRTKGTPEDNQAVLKNNNPHFGTYTVDEANRAIVFKIEHAMFPNWEGTEQKRAFTISGDELKYVIPPSSSSLGSGTGEVVWRRAK